MGVIQIFFVCLLFIPLEEEGGIEQNLVMVMRLIKTLKNELYQMNNCITIQQSFIFQLKNVNSLILSVLFIMSTV